MILGVAALGALNYSGFCMKEGRWLSDDEKIRAAIQAVVNRHTAYIFDATGNKTIQIKNPVQPYANIQEFLAINPQCCEIGPVGGDGYIPQTLYTRVIGKHAGNVVVRYLERTVESDGSIRKQMTTIQPIISNCGKVRIGNWH